MEQELTPIAARVLGCLVEKELATPEYYPLTLNALISACNQKSNREPVMVLTEDAVLKAIDELRFEQLAYKSAEGVRAERYCHNLEGLLKLELEEQAVLTVLLLRGPQTVGELRTRTERMYSFSDLDAVDAVLQTLMIRDIPLVAKLPRQPGRKEHRYAHLLCGEVLSEIEDSANTGAADQVVTKQERLAQLETEVTSLRDKLAALDEKFERFRSQFE